MNRYRQYGPGDDQPEVVGDAAFIALDMLNDPATLPTGTLSLAENMRFDANGTTVRGGLSRQFSPATSIGTILVAAVYQPAAGEDCLAFVTSKNLVVFNPSDQSVVVWNFPPGETAQAGSNNFAVQGGIAEGTIPAFWIQRGLSKDVLYFDGSTGITAVTTFPASEFALYYQDRMVVNVGSQQLGVSLFDDFTTFTLLNQFQIEKGGDDYLVGAIAYQKDYVLIAGRKTWWIAFFSPKVAVDTATLGYEGALDGDNSFLRKLTGDAGPVGPYAFCEAAGKIWFIGDGAIYAFTPQLDNELVVLGRAISAPIQPIMDRMNADGGRQAWVKRWRYRLYFGLPINDEPMAITSINSVASVTNGLTLPFTLPQTLTAGAIVTLVTAEPHGCSTDDRVLIAGTTLSALNGSFDVIAVIDDVTLQIAANVPGGSVGGLQATLQRVEMRNNRIAVFNMQTEAWESVDTLPNNFHADWGLVANYGSAQRLWIVDQDNGPALYEQQLEDDIGSTVGNVMLPFTLPVTLNAFNTATQPVPGRLVTRSFRWGYGGQLNGGYRGNLNSASAPRKVRQCEVRASLDALSALAVSFIVRTPNNTTWTGIRNFTAAQFETLDAPLRKVCGMRGLEAQIDLTTSGGRPTIRSVEVETAAVGRVAS